MKKEKLDTKKETIFFLAPYPQGKAPSQRFRFEQYLSFLSKKGFNCEVHSFLNLKGWNTIYKNGNVLSKIMVVLGSFIRRFGLLFKLKKADHIFIHREVSHVGPPIFEWIIAKVLKRKFIYDFDDAIWLPNYSAQNAKFQKLKGYGKVKKIMKWSAVICAGNQHLANFASQYNKNVMILPTTIDTENHHNELTQQNENKTIIGWTGTHTTAQYLSFLEPILQQLEEKHTFEFRVISNEKPQLALKNLNYIPWNKESEIKDLAAIHIGVMPLKDDVWAKGKCGFKALQYMALNIPAIISPVGVNTAIISDNENGFLADSAEEWFTKLDLLLQDISLRKRLGEAGRTTILERYSVLANKEIYLNLFK